MEFPQKKIGAMKQNTYSFPIWWNTDVQIQEPRANPKQGKLKKTKPKHILLKLLKTKDEENILKAAKRKKINYIQECK